MSGIPKILHFVWIGDDARRPDNCIRTWEQNHPDFEIRVWGNHEYETGNWRTKHHMDEFRRQSDICGAADLMRWEILLAHGGIALDADSVSLDVMPEWLLGCTAFACWENELMSPGLIANGYVGCHPGDHLIRHIVEHCERSTELVFRSEWFGLRHRKIASWKTVGPKAITDAFYEIEYDPLTILPSHFFIPRHLSGRFYSGSGPVYSNQLFASTNENLYGTLHEQPADALADMNPAEAAATMSHRQPSD